MEIPRPIITYMTSDPQIPNQLKIMIERDLPQEGIEWKRPYRRQIKTVYLEARFESFEVVNPPNAINATNTSDHISRWLEKQLLHTYWIECYDMDQYRTQMKEDLLAWVNRVSKDNISEWLVVLIDNAEKRSNKSKLLPRSSMLDKIKSDFPTSLKPLIDKHIIILNDPLKNESKSVDSFGQFLHKVRNLLLNAYSRQLVSYEDHIRAQREKRNSQHWDFFQFFLAQEELAFAFELLGLFDEALVQYDELDALFSQFILNSNVDNIPSWLRSLSERCDVWHGLCLSNQLCFKLRARLQSSQGNLLDLRNYLFARQCELLLLQHKPWEVASRSLQFLQNSVNEFKILEIKLMPGAISCWVYLSALEILLKCERYNDSSQMDAYSRYTIGIRAYAREKFKELGQLCGLLPGMNPAPNYLHHVVSLISGMGEDYHLDSSTPSPQSRLKESLSSPEAFLKSYLEFSELTMGTYKHIGRLREARLIGKELSFLYMKMGRYQQSLPFLLDLEKVFVVERWPRLRADTRKNIYKCYEKLGDLRKQLRYALLLSSSSMPDEKRMEYFENAMKLSDETELSQQSFSLRMDELLSVESIELRSDSEKPYVTNSPIHLKLSLKNNLVSQLSVDRISVVLETNSTTSYNSQQSNVWPPLSSQTPFHHNNQLSRIDENLPEMMTFNAATVGVKCVNVQKVLKRSDSHQSFSLDRDPVRERFDFAFTVDQVKLEPGQQELELQFSSYQGNHFQLKQVVVDWKHQISLISDPLQQVIEFDVHSQDISLELSGSSTGNLVVGIEQPLELIFQNGSFQLSKPFKCRLTASPGLWFLHQDAEKMEKKKEFDFFLDQDLASFERLPINLKVLADFSNLQKISILSFDIFCEFISGIDSQLTSSSSSPPLTNGTDSKSQLSVTAIFLPPFVSAFVLHTCADKKFIEVQVSGCCEMIFELFDACLKCQPETSFNVRLLGQSDRIDIVFNGERIHYMWQLESCCDQQASKELDYLDQLQFNFSLSYRLKPQDQLPSLSSLNFVGTTYECQFVRSHFQTLYEIRASISPQSGSEFCRVGQLCQLDVTIERTEQHSEHDGPIMYELVTDRSLWNVNGRAAGLLSQSEANKSQLKFELLPLFSGFLPMPSVRLSRYIAGPADSTSIEKLDSSLTILPTGGEAKIVSFEAGEVYNWSRSKQVNVLPSPGLLPAEV